MMKHNIDFDKAKKLEKNMPKALLEVTLFLLDMIKPLVPWLTGNLRSSYDYRKISNFIYRIFTDVEYATKVEYGDEHQKAQPHVRLALQTEKDRASELFRKTLWPT